MGAWKTSARAIIRRPAFTFTVVGLLVLGVGANTALFSIVDTVLLKPLAYPDAGQLVSLYEASPSKNEKLSLIAPGRLEDWNRLSRTLSAASGVYSENVTDTSTGQPIRLAGLRVAPRYFTVFATPPQEGRTFTPDEEVAGGRLAAVISYRLWSRGAVVGSRLLIGGQGFTIVGVMPKNFTSEETDVWLPAQTPPFLLQARDARFFAGVGRMKKGISVAQAQDDLAQVQAALGRQFPKSDKDWSVIVRDLKETRVGDSRRALLLLFGAVALLLLITVTNIASLFLTELGRREREMAIRSWIGGSRAQVVGELMRETALIALTGALGGWAAAVFSIRLLIRLFSSVPRVSELHVDWRALLFAIGVSLIGAASFGLLPALRATRLRTANHLFRAGRGVAGSSQSLQRVMIAGQIAVTVVLLASSAMLLRSFYALSHVDTGFDSAHTFTFHVGAAWDEDRIRVGKLQEHLIASLQKVPGVEAAGITNFLPASGATLRTSMTLDSAEEGKVLVGTRTISAGYLQAIRVPLLAGKWCPDFRGQSAQDSMATSKAMVNRRFTEVHGQHGDLVGQRISGMEIVGVVGDVREDALNAPAYPYVYVCALGGFWPDPEYVVRGTGNLAGSIRQVVKNVDPGRVLFGLKPLQEAVDQDLERPRANAAMITGFGIAAMMLAAIGLYGLVSQMVNSRRQEIGVRMALGAEPAQILRGVVGSAAVLAFAGIVVGLALTLAAQRTLQSFLFGIGATDILSLSTAVITLAVVVLAAAWIPARRAAHIDPVDALRAE